MSKMFGERLRELRAWANLDQADLGEVLGVSDATISRYESGQREPDQYLLQKIADHFKVSIDILLGREANPNISPDSNNEFTPKVTGGRGMESYDPGPVVLLPVYEEAAAGAPCFVNERPVGRQAVDASKVEHDLSNYILVRVRGESMVGEGIMPGGLVLVHRQEVVDDGQIAVVRLRDDGVTIKRVHRLDDSRWMLIPSNPSMREQIYTGEEINICGRVVQSITNFD